jgi:hypothetical protein
MNVFLFWKTQRHSMILRCMLVDDFCCYKPLGWRFGWLNYCQSPEFTTSWWATRQGGGTCPHVQGVPHRAERVPWITLRPASPKRCNWQGQPWFAKRCDFCLEESFHAAKMKLLPSLGTDISHETVYRQPWIDKDLFVGGSPRRSDNLGCSNDTSPKFNRPGGVYQ